MRRWHWGRGLQVGKTNRRFEGQWEGGEGAATPGNNRWVMWGISCLHRTEITTAFATWIIQAGWRIRSCNDRSDFFWQIRFCRTFIFQSQIQLKSMAVPSSAKMKGSCEIRSLFFLEIWEGAGLWENQGECFIQSCSLALPQLSRL